jgi:preprotein translocase subunit SecB
MPKRIGLEMTKLWLVRSIFQQNPEFELKGTTRMTSISLSIVNAGNFNFDNTEAEFTQFFQTKPLRETPFILEAEFRAQFSLSSAIPPEDKGYFMNEVFPQLIFPYMREYVAETTRRGGFPPLLINMSVSPAPRGAKAQGDARNFFPQGGDEINRNARPGSGEGGAANNSQNGSSDASSVGSSDVSPDASSSESDSDPLNHDSGNAAFKWTH